MEKYLKLREQYSKDYYNLNKIYNLISTIRLFVVIIMCFLIYKFLKTDDINFILLSILAFTFFIFLLMIHKKITWKRKIKEHLISINNNEIIYLKREGLPFENGSEYEDFKHFYSLDLDIFGENSLFQNLNRTATYIGSKKLSELLLTLLKNNEIESNQKAIKELSIKIEWRQYLLSLAKIIKDKGSYQKLIDWTEAKQEKISKPLNVVFHITPILFIVSVIIILLTNNPFSVYIAFTLFIVNLVLVITQLGKIRKQIIDSDKISDIIKQYGLIIEKIEREEFDSEKLNLLKKRLIYRSGTASQQIKNLSALFSYLQSIQNGMAAILFNGAILYHVHALNKLLMWKEKYAKHVKSWLEIIGEIEALNSIANFAYNNPAFVFPTLNENYKIVFDDLGHPLIPSERRICNSIEFNENSFIILTGSNMSGKSTFLRTLGINMILAGIGSPICSSKANVHPLNVLVSMRQSDSLSESESYFFAEVKRLKRIIDKLQSGVCFVLLDEILKGTNSDDKQTGTVEVIKKIISKNAIGVISTHDLEICRTTKNYEMVLVNKCFEVEFINNELSFDYKLKDGFSKKKSATFLMKKMEII